MASKFLIGVAEVCGIALIPFCVFKAWTKPPVFPSVKPYPSGSKDGPYRPSVDEWRWSFLNKWYGNSEDGVSGQQAWIWENGQLVTYVSTFPSWLRWQWLIATAWSVWRNGANNIKRPVDYAGHDIVGTV